MVRDLEAIPPAARVLFLRDRRIPPFDQRTHRDRFTNAETLRMALAAAQRGHWLEWGMIQRRLNWTGHLSRAVLSWGVRRGFLRELSNHRFLVLQVPELAPAEGLSTTASQSP